MDFLELIAALDESTYNALIGTLVGGIVTYFTQQLYTTKQTYKNRRDMDIAFKKIREIEKGLKDVQSGFSDGDREGF